jgi:hypothetical protein
MCSCERAGIRLCVLGGASAGGARIFFGHDPEFWKIVPQAPEVII